MELPKRIEDKINKQGPNGCWLWTGSLNKYGYGQTSIDRKRGVQSHIVVYQILVGEIPTGMELDHLCRVRPCVNPDHLEVVTHKVNIQRGDSGGPQLRRTHCPAGHPYDEVNTYHTPKGKRACRQCAKARWKKWKESKQLKGKTTNE